MHHNYVPVTCSDGSAVRTGTLRSRIPVATLKIATQACANKQLRAHDLPAVVPALRHCP
jgi:hypothetical protein